MGINLGSQRASGQFKAPVQTTRQTRPFGMKAAPFNPTTGTYLPLNRAGSVLVMIVVEEADDYVMCRDPYGQQVQVAKPYLLRRSSFDGLSVEGVTYAYSDSNTRVASDDAEEEEDETQEITPSYYAGEKLTAIAHGTGVTTALGELQWEDLNTAGRCWAVVQE
jgi:hypothetical protein